MSGTEERVTVVAGQRNCRECYCRPTNLGAVLLSLMGSTSCGCNAVQVQRKQLSQSLRRALKHKRSGGHNGFLRVPE